MLIADGPPIGRLHYWDCIYGIGIALWYSAYEFHILWNNRTCKKNVSLNIAQQLSMNFHMEPGDRILKRSTV